MEVELSRLTLSSIPPAISDPERVGMTDLPPEIILQIYNNLPTASSITALNRTSHYLYNIWIKDASSISATVLSNTIPHFDNVLEVVELYPRKEEENIEWDAWTDADDYLTNVQKRARQLVASARERGYQEPSSSHVSLREVWKKNGKILRTARMAAKACTMYQKAAEDEGTMVGADPDKLTVRGEILDAYYEIWKVTLLGWYDIKMQLLEALMDTVLLDRLEALSQTTIKAMVSVTRFLIFDCSHDDRCSLKISHAYELPGQYRDDLVRKIRGVWANAFLAIRYISEDATLAEAWGLGPIRIYVEWR